MPSIIKTISPTKLSSIRKRFKLLYGKDADQMVERLYHMIGRYGVGLTHEKPKSRWSQKDTILITYGDMVQTPNEAPLKTLKKFCVENLKGAIGTVHFLPFCPWSSDDGFSVIDYRAVDPALGKWENIKSFESDFSLMFDFVLNHCSSQSSWFKDYLSGIEPARSYFIEADPKENLSKVVRPRTSPLLTETQTRDGTTHVWTTFSADQVDLNWKSPDLFFEFLDILFLYLSKGARILRLDAIAFLWKKKKSNCLHLKETHEIVKLFRDILEIVSPKTLIITETNVPHEENISYFGKGDEAHMVYQFSLPPLLLHSLLKEDTSYLTEWALSLPKLDDNCTYFNFTASHDGIGVRPLQGLLKDSEIKSLVKTVKKRGGKVSEKNNEDDSKSPYELNITYFDALSDPDNKTISRNRFLCSQAVALALQGIPGVYFHSLTATPNNQDGYKETKMNRTLNRKKWDLDELTKTLNSKTGVQAKIFKAYHSLLKIRTECSAFHPNAKQEILDLRPAFFAFKRTSTDEKQELFCIFNFSSSKQTLNLNEAFATPSLFDLVSQKKIPLNKGVITFQPYQFYWLDVTGK